MPVPKIYRRSSDVYANYDFQDLASGFSYINFYGVAYLTGGTMVDATEPTKTYFLTNLSTMYPEGDPWTGGTTVKRGDQTSHTGTGTTTINFDSAAFNLARQAQGSAVVNFCLENSTGGADAVTVTAQVKKVSEDGMTVTNLTASASRAFPGATAGGENNILFVLPITTPTIIAAGEKTRLVVTLTCGDGGDTIVLHHNPVGYDVVSNPQVSTQLKLQMPFKVDI